MHFDKARSGAQKNAVGGLDTPNILTGENNKVIETLSFEFGQPEYVSSYLILTDAKDGRYSPPKNAFEKPPASSLYRLETVGFTYDLNPFSFKFTDTRNSSNVLVHTKGSNLYMTDK